MQCDGCWVETLSSQQGTENRSKRAQLQTPDLEVLYLPENDRSSSGLCRPDFRDRGGQLTHTLEVKSKNRAQGRNVQQAVCASVASSETGLTLYFFVLLVKSKLAMSQLSEGSLADHSKRSKLSPSCRRYRLSLVGLGEVSEVVAI